MVSVEAAVEPSRVRQGGLPSPRSNCVELRSSSLPTDSSGFATLVDCAGASAEDPETAVLGISLLFTLPGRAVETGLFGSGCSTRGALAFLFPRSLLVSEGFLCDGSSVFSSFIPAVPLEEQETPKNSIVP